MLLPPSSGRRTAACRGAAFLVAIAASLWLLACAAAERLPPPLGTERISRADQEVAQNAYERGLAAFSQGSYEPALSDFSLVVDRYPSSRYAGLALYWQGRTAYQLGRDQAASAALDRYLRLAPDVPYFEHASLLLANALYNQTRYEAALQVALVVDSGPAEWLDDYLALSRDLLNRLPRPAIEAAAARVPPRNFLAPFYLQSARWAHSAGAAPRATELASRVVAFPELPPEILAEARGLMGPAGRAAATAPRLGLLDPTDPRFASVAEEIRRGVEIALEDVNRGSGRSAPVTLVARSAETDPDSTAAVIRTLARNERVEAILGPLTSEDALPAARLAAEEGVPLVSPTATDARLLEIDPRVYTVNALDGAVGHTIGTFAVRSLERRRFAILAVDDAYGRIQADAFATAVETSGARVVYRFQYERGSTQYTDQLGAIVRSGADALFIATKSPNEALRILNQMAFYELGGILPLGTDAWNDPEFYRQGRRFVRGYFADTFSRDARITTWLSFADRYEARFGGAPANLIPGWGYDAARLALERLAHADGVVQGGEYLGATGLFRFGPQGIRRAVIVHRIERGEPVAVDW
ncbi:MAG TPA: ABC transporter substrate-binding protein [Gemmatimonadota bacterium]|nr:ABC transporter substrate-binding protein [Gemmatimonadota bacterium]